jgi:hypothetical protein
MMATTRRGLGHGSDIALGAGESLVDPIRLSDRPAIRDLAKRRIAKDRSPSTVAQHAGVQRKLPMPRSDELTMGWASDRWDAFNAAAGPRRYIMGGIVTIVIATADFARSWLTGRGLEWLVGVPSWLIAIIVALGLVAFWLLEHLAQLRRRMRGARLDLAKLRSEGVALRNAGVTMADDAWELWQEKVLKWNQNVIRNIREINEADAEWFTTLDIVPPPRIEVRVVPRDPQTLQAHGKLFREHDFRLKRLGRMIYRLWER